MSSEPLIPLRTRIVREPPRWPSAMSMPMSSPTTTRSLRRRAEPRAHLVHGGGRRLADHHGRAPVTFAIPAVTIAPRLKITPFEPQ